MKVILSAFGGKLESDVMNWPENTGGRIYLMLDMESTFSFEPEKLPTSLPKRIVGTFERIPGGRSICNGTDVATVYLLVDINKGG